LDELPRVSIKKRWYKRDCGFELVTALATSASAFVCAAIVFRSKGEASAFFVAIVSAGAAITLGTWRALRTKKKEDRYEPIIEPPSIVGWAHTLHHCLCREGGITDPATGQLRVVVHRVEYEKDQRTPKYLEQVISYVGGKGGPVGRKTPPRTGIIGKAVRTGKPWKLKRESQDVKDFVDLLVSDWGFYWEEATSISATRWSFAAFPFSSRLNGPIIGVVFADAEHPDFFTDDVMNIIYDNTSGLTEMIRLL
jgi:hypothetical protein